MPLRPLIAEKLDALSPPPLFIVVFWLSMHVCYETGVLNHTWLVRFSRKYSAGQPHCNRQHHAVQCTETWAVSSAPHNSNAASTPWMWVAFFSRKVTTQSIIAVYCNIAWSLSIRATGPSAVSFFKLRHYWQARLQRALPDGQTIKMTKGRRAKVHLAVWLKCQCRRK